MIGILTFHFAYNYGAELQAYALKKYLSQFDEVEIINYVPDKMWKPYSTKLIDKKVVTWPKAIFDIKKRKQQSCIFENFKRNYLISNNTSPLKSQNLKEYSSKFSTVIVGSDQVWNTILTKNDTSYFLDFLSENSQKIGYAISIGLNNPTDNLSHLIQSNIGSFSKISFRENSASNLVFDLTKKKYPTVVDPVFLLDEDNYISIEKKPENFEIKDYSLFYALKNDKKLIEDTLQLSKKLNCTVVSIHPMCVDASFKCVNLKNVGPQEFLYLVHHAKCIATNLFHATAFSVIFNKMALIEENQGTGNRISELFEITCKADGSIKYFDNSTMDKLKRKIEYSKEYISEAIQIWDK